MGVGWEASSAVAALRRHGVTMGGYGVPPPAGESYPLRGQGVHRVWAATDGGVARVRRGRRIDWLGKQSCGHVWCSGALSRAVGVAWSYLAGAMGCVRCGQGCGCGARVRVEGHMNLIGQILILRAPDE